MPWHTESGPAFPRLVVVLVQGEAGGRTEPARESQSSGGPQPPPSWHPELFPLFSVPELTSVHGCIFPESSLTCPCFRGRGDSFTHSHVWLISYSGSHLSPGRDRPDNRSGHNKALGGHRGRGGREGVLPLQPPTHLAGSPPPRSSGCVSGSSHPAPPPPPPPPRSMGQTPGAGVWVVWALSGGELSPSRPSALVRTLGRWALGGRGRREDRVSPGRRGMAAGREGASACPQQPPGRGHGKGPPGHSPLTPTRLSPGGLLSCHNGPAAGTSPVPTKWMGKQTQREAPGPEHSLHLPDPPPALGVGSRAGPADHSPAKAGRGPALLPCWASPGNLPGCPASLGQDQRLGGARGR